MAKFDITAKALDDLSNIWGYTYDNWSEEQADKYYTALTQSFTLIADNPSQCGKSYDEIRIGLRALHVLHHMVFFLVQASGKVLIVRVLYEQMDFTRHF